MLYKFAIVILKRLGTIELRTDLVVTLLLDVVPCLNMGWERHKTLHTRVAANWNWTE